MSLLLLYRPTSSDWPPGVGFPSIGVKKRRKRRVFSVLRPKEGHEKNVEVEEVSYEDYSKTYFDFKKEQRTQEEEELMLLQMMLDDDV